MKAEWTNADSLTPSETTGKSVLVIDTPKECDGCPCYHEGYGHCNNVKFRFIQDSDKVAPWCPLKPMPEKREPKEEWLNEYHRDEFADGWNACLKEITDESNTSN